MAIIDAVQPAPLAASAGSQRATRRTRSMLRALWWVIFIGSAILYAAALPARYAELRTLADPTKPMPSPADPDYVLYQLHPVEASILAEYRISIDTYALYMIGLEAVQSGVFVFVSLVLYGRQSEGVVAPLAALTILLMGVVAPGTVNALRDDRPSGWIILALDQLRLLTIIWFLVTFPDGKFVPRWTRPVAIASSLLTAVLPLFLGDPRTWSSLAQSIGVAVWIIPSLLIVTHRYRNHFTHEGRLQTRWVILGMAVVVSMSILRGVLLTLFPALSSPGDIRLFFQTVIAVPLMDTVLFLLIPLSIAASIFRYNLYGVNLAINRSLVYGGLTAGVAVVFFSGFFLIQALLRGVVRQETLTALIVAAAVSAALFNPARVRLQRWVDTHIFRLRVDLDRLERIDRKDRAISQAEAAANAGANPRIERSRAASIIRSGDLTGQTLGSYKIGSLIGVGGMGEVYRAQQPHLKRDVAVKVLGDSLYERPDLVARFEREAHVVAALNHPNIVRLFDYGVSDGVCYMVLEYLDGQPLNAVLRTGALPLDMTRRVLGDIAAALDYAHSQGVIHRDVKPGNVMLQRITSLSGQVDHGILMDFGIAKLRDDGLGGASTTLTATGMIGTLDYAAPEQITSAREVDHRADIYALGVMAYQMVTGRLPFDGSAAQIVFAHLQQPPPDPCLYCSELSAAAGNAIRRAMAKEPDARYPTAGAFISDLET